MTSRPRRSQRACPLCHCWHWPQCRAVPADTRWPLAPILALTTRQQRHRAGITDRDVVDVTEAGGLSDKRADRWAVRLGYHPEQIWPGWCETALTYTDAASIEGSRRVWLWREAQRTQPAHAPTQHLRRSA